MNTILLDNFNRADSTTIGNADTGQTWTKGGGIVSGDSIGDIRINSNTLNVRRQDSPAQSNMGIGTALSFILPITISGRIDSTSAGTSTGRRIGVGFRDTFSLNNLGLGFTFAANTNSSSNTQLYSDKSIRAQAQINWTANNYFWLDISEGGANQVNMSLYVSTTSTKPGSPSLTASNVADSSDIQNFILGFDPNTTTSGVNFDFIRVEDSSTPPANIGVIRRRLLTLR